MYIKLDPFQELHSGLLFLILNIDWDMTNFHLSQLIQILKLIEHLDMPVLFETVVQEVRFQIDNYYLVNLDLLLELRKDLQSYILDMELDLDFLISRLNMKCVQGQISGVNVVLENVSHLRTKGIKNLIKFAPCLKNVRKLDLEFYLDAPKQSILKEWKRVFFKKPRSQREGLESLSRKEVEKLSQSSVFSNLRSLRVKTNNEGAKIIAQQTFNQLIQLEMASFYSSLQSEVLSVIATSTISKHLRLLSLVGWSLGNEEVIVLSKSSNLTRLKVLDLSHNNVGVSGAEAISNSPYFKHLRTLILSSNVIRDEGAIAIATSSNMKNLRSLFWANNAIGIDGFKAFVESDNMKNIMEVNLAFNLIDEEEVEALFRWSRKKSSYRTFI